MQNFKNSYLFLFLLSILSTQAIAGGKDRQFENLKSDGLKNLDIQEYQFALESLLQADSIIQGDPLVEYSIGVCYLNSPFPSKALKYIEKSEVHGSHDPYLQYNFGRADHINHLFDDAILHYNTFLEQLNDTYEDKEAKEKEIALLVKQCLVAKEVIKDTLDIEIKNLGSVLNTEFAEYVPVVSADESSLFFTSRRPSEPNADKDLDNQHFEDIYYSKNINGEWSSPVALNDKINTDEHDACIGVSSDGQQLFMYKSRRSNSGIAGDIWVSHLEGDDWGAPIKLGENVNTKGWEPSATISSDGKKLFFTSNREGGYGGTDIYEADLGPDGEWGEAYNLGPTVNTEYDEDAPFIHADNKTLYYSSNGTKSMGGFDIFITTYDFTNKSWSEPINIGYPINTASHDIYMVWNAARTRGYFATYREDSYGKQDLYVLERPFEDAHLVLLKGYVTDSITNEPVAANIEIVDIETNEIVGEYNSNQIDGRYSLTLPHGRNYNITVETEGYLFYSKNIEIPESEHFLNMREDVALQKIYKTELDLDIDLAQIEQTDSSEIIVNHVSDGAEQTLMDSIPVESSITLSEPEIADGTKITLNNVFFDTDKADLRSTSYAELNNVYKLLSEHEDLFIELSGHTDDVNTHKYNQILSERRALAVVQYLVDKGIDAHRLVAIGHGETMPVAENDSEANRQLNRRTELKLIKESDVAKYSNRVTGLNKLVQTETGDAARAQKSASRSIYRFSSKNMTKPEVGQILSLKVHFLFDNYDFITEFSSGQIVKVMALLIEYPDLRLKIHAHSDPFGSAIYNQELSEKRAETVYNYLLKLEIDPSRLEISTYGEDMLLVESEDEAANLLNRRVEFEVIQ